MSELKKCVRNAIENGIFVNDAFYNGNITQDEYNYEIDHLVQSACMEIRQTQSGVEIL